MQRVVTLDLCMYLTGKHASIVLFKDNLVKFGGNNYFV